MNGVSNMASVLDAISFARGAYRPRLQTADGTTCQPHFFSAAIQVRSTRHMACWPVMHCVYLTCWPKAWRNIQKAGYCDCLFLIQYQWSRPFIGYLKVPLWCKSI